MNIQFERTYKVYLPANAMPQTQTTNKQIVNNNAYAMLPRYFVKQHKNHEIS